MKKIFLEIKRDILMKKIVKFFNENPTCVNTAEDIAKWISEEKRAVKEKMDYLVKNKILNKYESNAAEGYSYTQNSKIISLITELSK